MKIQTILKKFQRQTPVTNELEQYIEDYLSWYKDNLLNDLPENEQNYYLTSLRNFIDKMACWYEMRFPDSTLENSSSNEINSIMFDSSLIEVNWEDFFNTKKFIHSLPTEERSFMARPKYPEIVWLDREKGFAHLHLTAKGRITLAEGIYFIKKNLPKYEVTSDGIVREVKSSSSSYDAIEANLTGKTIKEALDYMHTYDIPVPLENGFQEAIDKYENQIVAKQKLLNAVSHRIMSRGEPQLAAIRALIFAQEFNTDINVPGKYGIYSYSPNRDKFIERFIEAGGDKDLLGYKNYRLSLNANRPADFTSPSNYLDSEKTYKKEQ